MYGRDQWMSDDRIQQEVWRVQDKLKKSQPITHSTKVSQETYNQEIGMILILGEEGNEIRMALKDTNSVCVCGKKARNGMQTSFYKVTLAPHPY